MYNRGTTDYSSRATNQMQGAAGTLSAMTKKQEVKTERPDTAFSDVVTTGFGLTMMGSELNDMDLFDFLSKDKDATKTVADASGNASTPSPTEGYLFGDKAGSVPGADEPYLPSSAMERPTAAPATTPPTPPTTTPGAWFANIGGGAVNTETIQWGLENANLGPSAMEAAPKIAAGTGVQNAGGPLAANGLGGTISTTGGAAIEAGTGLASTSAMEAATGGTVSAATVDGALAGVGTSGLVEAAGGVGAGTVGSIGAGTTGAAVSAGAVDSALMSMTPAALEVASGTVAPAAAPALASNPAGWIVGGAIGLGAIGAYLFS